MEKLINKHDWIVIEGLLKQHHRDLLIDYDKTGNLEVGKVLEKCIDDVDKLIKVVEERIKVSE